MNENIGFTIIVVLLLAASAISLNMFFKERSAHDFLDINTFPHKLGEWSGADETVTEKEYKILETRNLIVRDYTNPKGWILNLFIVYSETNRSVFHPPEVCFLGGGISIVDKKIERVKDGGYNFTANKMYTEKGEFKQIVLYTYKAGKLYTSNFYLQQAYLAIGQLFGKNTPGATIRVSMPVIGSEEDTVVALKKFLVEVVNEIASLRSQ
ncbi:MAG: EpsI family protein [Candidatus Omnitrophica bacterium]|nr:EpsI family protein [Candidatus Omnitrophota bacterium]